MRILQRALTCIYNDLYASSLAKLRPLERVDSFLRPADIHVVKRLGHFAFLPFTFVPFFPLFQERASHVQNVQSPIGRCVHCPRDLYAYLTAEQCYVKTRESEEIHKSLVWVVQTDNVRLSDQFRGIVSDPVLSLEFMPLFNRTISPPALVLARRSACVLCAPPPSSRRNMSLA